MKKIIAVVMLAVLMLALAACGSKFTCDLCMEEKSGKQKEVNILGTKQTVCEDCYKQLNALTYGMLGN